MNTMNGSVGWADAGVIIGDSIRLCVDVLDGKAKNIVAMKGE